MTYFVIPMMFLQCMNWHAHDGETIQGFRFEQPVTITASDNILVIVKNNEFTLTFGCHVLEAYNKAEIDFNDELIDWRTK